MRIFNLKKTIIFPFLAFILFFTSNTQTAHALIPVIDATLIAEETARGVVDIAHDTYQDVIKMAGDLSAYSIAQATMDMLIIDSVRWIQTGLNGNPLFATNQAFSSMSLTDAMAGTFSNQLRNYPNMANFGPSFQNNLANGLSLNSLVNQGNKFRSAMSNPYSQYGVTPQQLLNDPSRGTWDTYYTSLKDSGNPYGVELMTTTELRNRQALALETQHNQLNQSNGFLGLVDLKSCNYPDGMNTDFTGVDEAAKQNIQQVYCKTTTPGAIIGDTLSNVTATPLNRLNNVDSINKFIAGFITQFAMQTAYGFF